MDEGIDLEKFVGKTTVVTTRGGMRIIRKIFYNYGQDKLDYPYAGEGTSFLEPKYTREGKYFKDDRVSEEDIISIKEVLG